jgi:hypothetical protein
VIKSAGRNDGLDSYRQPTCTVVVDCKTSYFVFVALAGEFKNAMNEFPSLTVYHQEQTLPQWLERPKQNPQKSEDFCIKD